MSEAKQVLCGVLREDLAPGGRALVHVAEGKPLTVTETTHTVYGWGVRETIPAGVQVVATYHEGSGDYVVT